MSVLASSCGTNSTLLSGINKFFNMAMGLYKVKNPYEILKTNSIIPSKTVQYLSSKIIKILTGDNKNLAVVINCRNGALAEIHYFYTVKGVNTFLPTSAITRSNCPKNVHYPPKTEHINSIDSNYFD